MTALHQPAPEFRFDLDACQQLRDRKREMCEALRDDYRDADDRMQHRWGKHRHRGAVVYAATHADMRTPRRVNGGKPYRDSKLVLERGDAQERDAIIEIMGMLNEECLRRYGQTPFNVDSVDIHEACLRYDIAQPFITFEIVIAGTK